VSTACRHYLTGTPDRFLAADVVDPDGHLELNGLKPSALVTAVIEVTAPDRRLVVRAAYPTSRALIRQLKSAGLTMWQSEEHAAWTDYGWIDIEALEGEPMERPHR
jgi:hypothetical protein